MAEIKSLIDEKIEEEIRRLGSISDGDARSKAIDDLAQLHKLRVEEIKVQTDADEKREQRVNEINALNQQTSENRIDRWVKVCVAGVELVVPLVFYGVWMRRGLKFEETGSYTSTTFRNLLTRFKPTK